MFFFSMALPAHSGSRPLMQVRNDFSQTVGLLGRVISPSQGHYLHAGQHKQNKHPCLKWGSNLRSQRPSEWRQFIPQTGRLQWPAQKCFFFPLALQPTFGLWPTSMKLSVSLQFTRFLTFGRTPWTGDQLVARPLPVHKHRKKHIHKH
jgi:hypothetical protein